MATSSKDRKAKAKTPPVQPQDDMLNGVKGIRLGAIPSSFEGRGAPSPWTASSSSKHVSLSSQTKTFASELCRDCPPWRRPGIPERSVAGTQANDRSCVEFYEKGPRAASVPRSDHGNGCHAFFAIVFALQFVRCARNRPGVAPNVEAARGPGRDASGAVCCTRQGIMGARIRRVPGCNSAHTATTNPKIIFFIRHGEMESCSA